MDRWSRVRLRRQMRQKRKKYPQHVYPTTIWSLYNPKITLRQNHTNTQKPHHYALSLKTISHPFGADTPASRLDHRFIHSFSHRSHKPEDTLYVLYGFFGFTTMSWLQRTWGGRRQKQKPQNIYSYHWDHCKENIKSPVNVTVELNLKHLKYKIKEKYAHLWDLNSHSGHKNRVEALLYNTATMDHVSLVVLINPTG